MVNSYYRFVKRLSQIVLYCYNMGLMGFVFGYVRYKIRKSVSDVVSFGVETVTVKTVKGSLRGRKCTSVYGKPYYRFQGVRYAQPPIGPLRFKDPQPLEPWEGVQDALKEGHVCAQYDIITGVSKGSEDCLVLNIFTPQLSQNGEEGKAVLVWVHGGAFQIGSGNAEIYGPDFFLNEDVILVTLNYRLGALGFLSTGTAEAPGNAGLKDITMALKWIQENISVFGGNPNNVTIFGESAGGAAVHYQLLSPLAKGLFHKAISQSGSALSPWAFSRDPVDAAFRLGKTFGCDTKDPKVLLESLRKVPAKVLAKRQNSALSEQNKRELISFTFLPCVEPAGYENPFLTDTPLNIVQQGRFNDVPYITGTNEREGILLVKPIIDKKPSADQIEKDFERVVPWNLNLKYGSEESKEAARRIRKFYFNDKPFNKETFSNYADLTTDSNFLDAAQRTTKYHATLGQSPVYNYLFTYEGNLGFFKKLLNINISGPAHADEIGYLFYIPIIGPNTDPKTQDMKVAKQMVRLWTNFAKYGDPTPHADADLNVKWENATPTKMSYLEIGKELKACQDVEKKRMDFWHELHQLSEEK